MLLSFLHKSTRDVKSIGIRDTGPVFYLVSIIAKFCSIAHPQCASASLLEMQTLMNASLNVISVSCCASAVLQWIKAVLMRRIAHSRYDHPLRFTLDYFLLHSHVQLTQTVGRVSSGLGKKWRRFCSHMQSL